MNLVIQYKEVLPRRTSGDHIGFCDPAIYLYSLPVAPNQPCLRCCIVNCFTFFIMPVPKQKAKSCFFQSQCHNKARLCRRVLSSSLECGHTALLSYPRNVAFIVPNKKAPTERQLSRGNLCGVVFILSANSLRGEVAVCEVEFWEV